MTTSESSPARTVPAVAPPRGRWRLRSGQKAKSSRRLPVVSLTILAILLVCGLFAPWVAPHDPLYGELGVRNLPPFWLSGGSTHHLLGTDELGRDMLSRLIFGIRNSMLVSLVLRLIVAVRMSAFP